jgi:hypothetical protein
MGKMTRDEKAKVMSIAFHGIAQWNAWEKFNPRYAQEMMERMAYALDAIEPIIHAEISKEHFESYIESVLQD